MRAAALGLLALAGCGAVPDRDPDATANEVQTVPQPSAVPGAPRIPAEEAPPTATTRPPR